MPSHKSKPRGPYPSTLQQLRGRESCQQGHLKLSLVVQYAPEALHVWSHPDPRISCWRLNSFRIRSSINDAIHCTYFLLPLAAGFALAAAPSDLLSDLVAKLPASLSNSWIRPSSFVVASGSSLTCKSEGSWAEGCSRSLMEDFWNVDP